MANKRNLKKSVRRICSDIATECMITAEYVKGIDPRTMYAIVDKVASLQENALKSISFSFYKVPSDFVNRHEYNKARNDYFKKAFASFRQKLSNHVNDIVKEMNESLPAEVKKANIKA